MKRRKATALFLAAVLAVGGMLAGCGSSGKDAAGADETETAVSSEQGAQTGDGGESKAQGEEISFPLTDAFEVDAFAFGNTGQELDKTLTMQVMEERTNIHWNVTTASQAELVEKRNLSFNSGDYYDVYIKSGIDAVETYKYAQQGVIIPLNDLIDQYMPNLKKALDEEGVWDEITSADGNIYALPQLNGPELASAAVYINQKWLDTLQMAMPQTQEEFLEALRAFRDEDPNGNGQQDEYGLYCPQGAVGMLMPVFGIAMDYQTMSMYDHDSGTMTYVPTSEEYRSFLAFMAQAYQEGLINEDCYTASWDDMNAIGATQDVLGTMATYGAYQHVGTERDEDYEALLPFEGKHTMPAGKGVGYGALVITDKCERPELICAWADYLYTEEGAILGRMGVEGETFTVDEEGKYHWKTDGQWGSDINSIRNTAAMFGWYPAPLVRAKFFDEGQSNPEELFLYQQRQQLLEYAADPYPTLPWTEEELTERAALVTTINAYIDEYQALVVTGQTDLDGTWEEYTANLANMGVQRLQEIDAAAYQRWLDSRS